MKVSLLIEDKKKGKIKVPVSLKELEDVYDGILICSDDNGTNYHNLKLNKVDKGFFNFHKKLSYLIHDVIHDGKVYELDDRKLDDRKKLSFKPCKKRHYIVKKPRWNKVISSKMKELWNNKEDDAGNKI